GIVATKLVPKGSITWILEASSKHYTKEQLKKFSKSYQNKLAHYIYHVKGQIRYVSSDSKYFNHSCNANTIPYHDKAVEMDVALKDIKPGEEATYEYGFLVEDDEIFDCHCGEKNCRKVITKIKPGSKLWKQWEKNVTAVKLFLEKVPQPIIEEAPCPCRSGKKYKKCGYINTLEHNKLMAQVE
ncbi:MAG TPA: SET domain-containing protein-lysine N-methyltransferase, partial [Verrucomicrobiae bacterium]|nr:SET domain-containing protein-lysine N-methyltransferase [Verrucomicrobiae bacterium]